MFNFYYNFKNRFYFILNNEKFNNVKNLDSIINNNCYLSQIVELGYKSNVLVFKNMLNNIKLEFFIKDFFFKLKLIKIIFKLQLNYVFN